MGQDWFAQQEADWFSQKEKEFAGQAQTPIMANGPTATFNKQGPGIPQPPMQPGRMGGPGAGPAAGASTLNPEWADPVRQPGQFMRDSLPALGGIAGGAGAAYATGGMSIPIQALIGVGAAGVGAGTGSAVKQGLNAAADIPAPPGGFAGNVWKDALMHGIIPEIGGQMLGGIVRGAGNIKARRGAATRNAELIDKTANPYGEQMSPGGREVGTQTQIPLAKAKKATKDPLEARFDALLKSPWGRARQIDIEEGPLLTENGPGSFTVRDEPSEFSITEKGPTNAARHQKRGDLLEDARGAARRDDPKAARRDRAKAAEHRAGMEKAAADNGLSMNEYNDLTEAWSQMSAQFDNNFMKQIRNQKGSNFIDTMITPKTWKTRMAKMATKNGDIDIPLDNPSLIRNLRENIGEEAFGRLQVAVQKAIVRRSTGPNQKINAGQLFKKLRDMVDYGAKDLVPQQAEIRELAELLDANAGTPDVPGFGVKTGAINFLLRKMGIDTPDLARAKKLAPKGAKGKGQKITERTTQGLLSFGAGVED